MSLSSPLLETLKHGLITSCQPIEQGPMDDPEIIGAMAQAAVAGGSRALRIEGVNNVRLVKELVSVPIIGIVKRDLPQSPVRITPLLEDVAALAGAGADIIAYDATLRSRPVSPQALLAEIHRQGKPAMADCSDLSDGMSAWQSGADLIGTTLSGYTQGHPPVAPDLELVRKLALAGCKVVAEGRYNTPELASEALMHGAFCVTVGSAITRIEHICQWFCLQMSESPQECYL
ncbi:N-acetylmannosamine-6-phosphate 2-epimerase [Dongshaea marina]|uniref:N-acetylmannosamine-6-phosphate 2-epimerase n=1 Tax=Dongshaea marina TaxID=2047966 RepID=UPI000D3EB6BB|nr:N-acetylmannosamine-6-phosphate 2-epimerase [Dongshaea marina]